MKTRASRCPWLLLAATMDFADAPTVARAPRTTRPIPVADAAAAPVASAIVPVLAAVVPTEMAGPVNKLSHMGCRMDRERMLGEAWPGRNVRCHLANEIELLIGRLREQCDHQVLERDHTDAQVHQLGLS